MIQQAFAIYSEDTGNSNLFIEHGNNHIACWVSENNTGNIKAFELFRFSTKEAKDTGQLAEHVFTTSKILQQSFDKSVLISEHPYCTCVPEKFYSAETAAPYLQLMFPDNASNIDTAMHNGMVILSSAQINIINTWKNKMNVTEHLHKYVTLIKKQLSESGDKKLYCIFYTSYFILSAYKNNQLLIIRHFDYTAAEDALYHILNTMKQFDLDAETPVIVSGSIDTDSPLYQTLHGYIAALAFENADRAKYKIPTFDPYPLHYFTSFCEYGI